MRSASEDERPWVSLAFQGEFVGRQRQGRWLVMSATAALQQNDLAVGGHSVDAPRRAPAAAPDSSPEKQTETAVDLYSP